MENLPNEMVVNILGFVSSAKDIAFFGGSCKHFHNLVKSEDKRLARKTYGNPRIGDTTNHCLFHITPSGVLHGRAVLTRADSTFVGTFVEGLSHGFYMIYDGESITEGKRSKGKNTGSTRTRVNGMVVDETVRDETGDNLLFIQSLHGSNLLHVVCPGWINVYFESPNTPNFYCEETQKYVKVYTKKMVFARERKYCSSVHHQCCDKHRNGMPKLLF